MKEVIFFFGQGVKEVNTFFDISRAISSAIPVPAFSSQEIKVRNYIEKTVHLRTQSLSFEYLRLTSPAPKNKKVWSANCPPINFKDAISPAKTTDAVPWTKMKETTVRNSFPNKSKISNNSQKMLPVYHH